MIDLPTAINWSIWLMLTEFTRSYDIADHRQCTSCTISIKCIERVVGIEGHAALIENVAWLHVLEELEECQRIVDIVIGILIDLPTYTCILEKFGNSLPVEGITVEWLTLSIGFTAWKKLAGLR